MAPGSLPCEAQSDWAKAIEERKNKTANPGTSLLYISRALDRPGGLSYMTAGPWTGRKAGFT
jgi:hypothetical protein